MLRFFVAVRFGVCVFVFLSEFGWVYYFFGSVVNSENVHVFSFCL